MRNRLFVVSIIVTFVSSGAACGKKAGPTGSTPAAAPPVAAEAGAAENLGKKIGSSYIETLKQVVAMMQDKPAAFDAKAMLTDMKAWTIELMIGLGKEREALPAGERVVVDRVLSQRIVSVPSDLFKDFQEGQVYYKDDRELFELIADFNIITQYANFDLLKKQLPEEAKRLGLQ